MMEGSYLLFLLEIKKYDDEKNEDFKTNENNINNINKININRIEKMHYHLY